MRVTSVTYPDTTRIHFVYNSGTDDILSRLSGKKEDNSGSPGDWIFQDAYLGSGRLVEREYGDSSGSPVSTWTLVGTDSVNNDNYVGLDRMGRIDDLIIKDSSTNLNRYEYVYSYGGQVTWKKDRVGKIFGYDVFNEWNQYDDLGRIIQRTRGDMNSGETDIPYPEQDEKWDWDTFGNLEKYCKTAAGTSQTCPNATYETSFLYPNYSRLAYCDAASTYDRCVERPLTPSPDGGSTPPGVRGRCPCARRRLRRLATALVNNPGFTTPRTRSRRRTATTTGLPTTRPATTKRVATPIAPSTRGIVSPR